MAPREEIARTVQLASGRDQARRGCGSLGSAAVRQFPGMPQSMVLDEMHMLAEEVLPKVRQGL